MSYSREYGIGSRSLLGGVCEIFAHRDTRTTVDVQQILMLLGQVCNRVLLVVVLSYVQK